MKIEEYMVYLRRQGASDNEAEESAGIIGGLVKHLAETGTGIADAGKEHVLLYAKNMIAQGINSEKNFSILRDYAGWLGLRPLYVAFIELMDCYPAMGKLSAEIEKRHGAGMRDSIFSEPLPSLGADESERYAYTRNILTRMAGLLSGEESKEAWFHVQHGLPDDFWKQPDEEDRKKFSECGGIDAFLDSKRRERNAMLGRLHDEDKLWYTVEITDEVLDYITNDPKMEIGGREGRKIFITKVPYNAARYLRETDERMKRYYACHCPLVREGILRGDAISPDVCNCSLGHASHYLAGLGLKLKGEVLESAVKGDTRCRFVFYLPESGQLPF